MFGNCIKFKSCLKLQDTPNTSILYNTTSTECIIPSNVLYIY